MNALACRFAGISNVALCAKRLFSRLISFIERVIETLQSVGPGERIHFTV